MRLPLASEKASTKALVGVAGEELAELLEDALSIPEPAPSKPESTEPERTDPEDVLILDDTMAVEPEPAAEPEADEPEDVLILDDTMAVGPEPMPVDVAELARLAAALLATEPESTAGEPEDVLILDDTMAVEPEPAPPAVMTGRDPAIDVAAAEPDEALVLDGVDPAAHPAHAVSELDDAFLAILPPYEPPGDDEDPLVEPHPDPPLPSGEPDMPGAADVAHMVAAQLAAHGIAAEERGDYSLPERRDILVRLLADPPPAQDFVALDMLYACWPKNTTRSASRALLAVALNLSSSFGLPGRLPMAASKAWRMLDCELFETDLAQRLLGIGEFISGWQRQQSTFLILEFGEIELIEYLFESLPPSRYTELLNTVMDFKVLSNRRMGLLRRIPNRLKKQVQAMLPGNRDEALVLLAHSKALLEKLAQPPGFPPLMETAERMIEEIEKIMKQTAAAGPPAPPPNNGAGGQPLGKIG